MIKAFLKRYIFAIATVLFITSPAVAGDTGLSGFNNQLFRPTVDGYGLYNTNASKVLPHLTYSFGFSTNFSRNLMNVYMPARRSNTSLISNDFAGDFCAAIGLFNFIDTGIDIPVTFYEDGTNYNSLQSYNAAAIGDIRFDAKFKLMEDRAKSVGIALLSSATFPTGSRSKFTGDKGLTWEGKLIVDKTFKLLSLYANMGYRFVKSVNVLATNIDDRITYSGGVSVPIPLGDRSWSALFEVAGETIAKDIKEMSSPLEIRGGVRKEFDSGLTLNFGGGGGVVNAFGSPDFRLFAGISFNLAKRRATLARQKNLSEKLGAVVYFGFDSYKIKESDYPKLRELGQKVAVNPENRVEVSGYTDSTGPKTYNKRLSRYRAENVKNFLIYSGASSGQIDVRYYGEERPAASNSTRDGRESNRRVEIGGE